MVVQYSFLLPLATSFVCRKTRILLLGANSYTFLCFYFRTLNSQDSSTPGKVQGDHAGHLAGDRFGGSPDIDNLVSQMRTVNLSQYKKLENKWAQDIRDGKKVEVDIKARQTHEDIF